MSLLLCSGVTNTDSKRCACAPCIRPPAGLLIPPAVMRKFRNTLDQLRGEAQKIRSEITDLHLLVESESSALIKGLLNVTASAPVAATPSTATAAGAGAETKDTSAPDSEHLQLYQETRERLGE